MRILVLASLLAGCASTTTAAPSAPVAHAAAPAVVPPQQAHQDVAPAPESLQSATFAQSAPAPVNEAPKEDMPGLRAQVRARRAELTQCYANTPAARSGRAGCVPVHFTLASDGRMKVSKGPKYSSSDLRSRIGSNQCGSNPRLVDPALEACVAAVFARIRVEQPRSTESVEGIYPVYFASK